MSSSHTGLREKILKSWLGISEVALIKEVATKGEHIQLCIEHLAKKRKMDVVEYKLFFQDVVQTYVQRLLSERLVCKAENVLNNVQRDIKCFYYQFACESDDAELRELLMDYLCKREPSFTEDIHELQFHWELLQQLQLCPDLMAKCKAKLRRLSLEALMTCEPAFVKRLMVELYLESRNPLMLERVNKFVLWECLVETSNENEMIRWCCLSTSAVEDNVSDTPSSLNELEQRYCQWMVEDEMMEYAVKMLSNPCDALRNCFAKEGSFFADERDLVKLVTHRLCTTESLARNQEVLEKLPIGSYIVQREVYFLLLRNFVNTRRVEEMVGELTEKGELLNLIAALKDCSLNEREGFEKISQVAKTFLENKSGVDQQNEQNLATFYEFLCNEPTVAALNFAISGSALKQIPYLKTLVQRLETSNGNAATCTTKSLPTPYDFLSKFKNIDFKEVCKDTPEMACFSSERLCQKYARKYNLNFMHYLKQQRSSFAVYYLIMEHLQNYGQLTKVHMFRACESVTELVLQYAANEELAIHCVAFVELLGFDTQNLRNFLKLSRFLAGGYLPNYSVLLSQVERLLMDQVVIRPDDFPLRDYQALVRMVLCTENRHWPGLIFRRYASEDNWWRLLVLLQYFDVPLQEIHNFVEHFGSCSMGEHLLRALCYDTPTAERGVKRPGSFSRQQKKARICDNNLTNTSAETLTSSMSSCTDAATYLSKISSHQQMCIFSGRKDTPDIFALILLSMNTSLSSHAEERPVNTSKFLEIMHDSHGHGTSWNLLKNCVKFRLPVLALLASTVNADNQDWHWLTWLAVATNQWQEVIHEVPDQGAQKLVWSLLEKAVREGCTSIVYRSFSLFYEDNPLEHLFKFLYDTQHNAAFSKQSIDELRLYLLAWSNDEVRLPFSPLSPLSPSSSLSSTKRDEIMKRSIKLLLLHLQHNFDSSVEQCKFISGICSSDMNDISGLVDFCLLHEILTILESVSGRMTELPINFEALLQQDNQEYENLLALFLGAQEYELAIRLATLLHLPIGDVIHSKWVASLKEHEDAKSAFDEHMFQQYEEEVIKHALPPEALVNFFLYAGSLIGPACPQKYLLLLRALNVIKKNHLFPNESFDRDQIEYEMIVCYLQIEDAAEIEALEIHHSEYFEQIMLKERCVLYKSFLELKELAGIDDLSVTSKVHLTVCMQERLEAMLNRLLDEGDIVEALRLQELFECRPIDLRFVVFCMALAEGVTTIFSMSSEERQLLCGIEKSSFAKFNRRTLSNVRAMGTHQQGPASPTKIGSDLSDSCSTLEFEEIPSKEKQETLDTIQGIASKLKYGVVLGKRIVLAYRAAMYLDKDYLDVLRTKDVSVLLRSVAEEDCLHKLLVVSDILTSTHMSSIEIAELLASEITTAVVRPRFYIFSLDHQEKNIFKNASLWGYNIDRDLHLLLELAPSSTKLGNCLLDYCDALKAYRKYQDNRPFECNAVFDKLAVIIGRYGLPTTPGAGNSGVTMPLPSSATYPPQVVSHKKQNLIYVELLIKAHQCFVHECSMEGIANVLNRAKVLNGILTKAKSWSLIVRMLIGIARYREMFYCFDSLIKNEQFESLLGQFDEEKTIGLRQAILTHLREYCPSNGREYLKLAALHFLMYKDLAEMWQEDAQAVLAKVVAIGQVDSAQLVGQNSMASLTTPSVVKMLIPKLKSCQEVVNLLHQALENYTHATENYLLDGKMSLAQRSASMAEMIAVQIDLANRALENGTEPHLCVCVTNVQTREEFRELINSELSVPQAMILGRAYDYEINWTEVLLSQYVILCKSDYLSDFMTHHSITDSVIENVAKGYQMYVQRHKPARQMEEHLAHLAGLVKSVTLKYKLASLLSIKPMLMSLINDQSVYYLRDTNFGRKERHNLLDM